MSDLSSISSSSSTQQLTQSQWEQRRSEFQQLGQALQSGDLAAAQKAFSALEKDAPAGAQSTPGNAAQGPFAALGQALTSGDLSAAQQAFTQLQQTKGHHHRHHGSRSAPAAAATPAPEVATPAAVTGTSGIDLTA